VAGIDQHQAGNVIGVPLRERPDENPAQGVTHKQIRRLEPGRTETPS
jgi:hypothetical protein